MNGKPGLEGRSWIRVTVVLLFVALDVWADKGHIWPHPVALSEASQRAIILHNRSEEVLILGIELKAQEDTEILEFIPLPTEPQVTLAQGDPFAQMQQLIERKGLEFESPYPVKGGPSTFAVEVRFSATVGLHDVTIVQVHDVKGFSDWVEQFFKGKGRKERPDLAKVLLVVEDYVQRGFSYFVFDYVQVGRETKAIEPLVYRFKTERFYYPLKTSNIVGGKGIVDLIMLMPGSFAFEPAPERAMRFWRGLRTLAANPNGWLLSSSSKIYPGEAKAVYPQAGAFFSQTKKLYLQVLRYVGEYRFKDDLLLDPGDTVPFAHKFRSDEYGSQFGTGLPGSFFEKFTVDEMADYLEANPGSPLAPQKP